MAWISTATTRARCRLASIAIIVFVCFSEFAVVTAAEDGGNEVPKSSVHYGGGGESESSLTSRHHRNNLRRTTSVISHHRRHQRQLQQNGANTTTEHSVTMVFSLHYLNGETATLLEIPDPTNDLVLHFCKSVNKRARSKQVNAAASGFGATVVTKVLNATVGDGVPGYQCAITSTNRDYDNDGEDVFGQGFFILEVEVSQIVYVTTESGVVLAEPIVRDIVESGFNRGEGGRVRFRALLQQHPSFSTVLNIEVLENLSAPQSAPTPKPSASPSQSPTLPPTLAPSNIPSAAPTLAPTEAPTNAPTTLVQSPTPSSAAPTTVPTTFEHTPTPSNARSEPPSSRPSDAPIASLSPQTPQPQPPSPPPPSPPSSYNRRALILGAIAGGVVTIIISLFFIFCVWFPLCGRNKDEEDVVTVEDDPGNRRCRPSGMSPSRLLGLKDPTIVPDVVQLDSENESLADTTLDSRKPGGKKLDARMFDSFDESSIYTEGLSNDNKETGRAAASMVLPPSLTRALDYEEDIVFEASGSATDSSAGADVGSSKYSGVGAGIIDSSNTSQALQELDELVAKSADSSPSSFPGTETVRSDENRAREVARSMNSGMHTKGFDPFGEDTSGSSSFEFDSEGVSEEAWRPEPYSADDDQSSPSSSSSRTERIKNLLSAPGITERLISPTEEEKREVDDEIRDYPPPSPPLDHRDANNELLRTVLEDARRSMSTSARSKLSRKSAPSRVLAKKVKARDVEPPHDLLADHQDLEEHMTLRSRASRTKASSKSVGALKPPVRRSTREGNPVRPSSEPEAILSTGGTATDPPHRTLVAETTSKTRPRNQTMVAFEASTPEIERKKSHPDTPLTSPSGKLGAQPRGDDYCGQILPETPGSSPGVLGIAVPPQDERVMAKPKKQGDASSESEGSGLSNPWLFDEVEKTLGPLSPAADMESISGRSNRSGKSLKSSRSGKSRQSHRSHRSYNSYGSASTEKQGHLYDLDRYSRSSTGQRPIVDGSLGEHKSASDEPMKPRTLEYGLQRLEIQPGKNHEPSDQTTTSSITASSAGASRSTLSSKPPASSRVTIRRSKKKRVVLVVPPGKLGVVLADHRDGKGTVVSEVRASSTINGMLSPGDKLVAIDGEDCTSMVVSEITNLMAARAHKERSLTVLTSSRIARIADVQEAKYDETDDFFS